MNLGDPVRAYFDALVHACVRHDPLLAARHRGFIASRIVGGLFVLAILPAYLVLRGGLDIAVAAVLAWVVAAIANAAFLSRTGRYEDAHAISSFSLAALIVFLAASSGGLGSPAAIWLAVIPVEAAVAAARRVVINACIIAFAGAVALLALTGSGYVMPQASATFPLELTLLSVIGATLYGGWMALRSQSIARKGSELLDAEEERYRLFALTMTDAISRHGAGGSVLFMSPAGEAIFGAPVDDLLGHGVFDRVHVADRPAYLTALSEAAARTADSSVEFRIRRDIVAADGSRSVAFAWVEMRCRALQSVDRTAPDRAKGDVVAVMRDVSERKAQEQEVTEAHSETTKANAAKSRFLATMSHELRTPLNAIIGFSEMLMQEETMRIDVARRRDYARLINDSGQHLLSVVNLILDMSKIETGNFVIAPEPMLPTAVIRNSCDLLALKAHEAGLEITVRVPELPEMIADKRALKQILINLLSNAIKFTERGGAVTVTASVEAGDLVMVIADTGVGISPDDLPRLGDPFFQTNSSYSRPFEGTGLGLSIVKGLVELHGGRMEVASRLGVGTQVTVRLPLKRDGERDGKIVALTALSRDEPEEAARKPQADRDQEIKKSA